eukprot:TRINITY_DN18292_c0_g1_i11.p2 TRINITY_DN18292_c0_g1~~TRINITY_DN18292_c0_g1_i11.p2  ORF type:complete len:119 (+),score=0.51 TRINITY_DN18292_c0_g1_i11:229-585(+)
MDGASHPGHGTSLNTGRAAIVYDVSFKPPHDQQAVCRAYRSGLRHPCFVHLVADGTWQLTMTAGQCVTEVEAPMLRLSETRATRRFVADGVPSRHHAAVNSLSNVVGIFKQFDGELGP